MSHNAPKQKDLTIERLSELLDYDSVTGALTWTQDRGGNAKKGCAAGYSGKKYRQIRIDGRSYRAHHLAWFAHYKRWPVTEIDHIDGNGDNNRIVNLRLVTTWQQAINKKRSKRNISGFTGVVWDKDRRKWVAQIQLANKQHRLLGRFATKEEAVTAPQSC